VELSFLKLKVEQSFLKFKWSSLFLSFKWSGLFNVEVEWSFLKVEMERVCCLLLLFFQRVEQSKRDE